MPLVIDLWTRTTRWAGLNLSAAGYGHNVAGSAGELGALGAALEAAFRDRVPRRTRRIRTGWARPACSTPRTC
ncbi:hypothetical protein ACU635_20020 [[Actinomadura] parvosata]|uniref:hypothetical protein n=1 Tax=[Actinomadura] parvosata TaxID=1955412 RepID=UPI00406D0351